MKKYLLPEKGKFFKANLHSHTSFSDGKKTPQEVKELYMERGYSIVAYTDHDAMFSHYDELHDENFLPLIGYEISMTTPGQPYPFLSTLHANFISPDPEKTAMPFFHKNGAAWLLSNGWITQEQADALECDGILNETPGLFAANVNAAVKIANEKGFLTALNHPTWSLFDKSEYLYYEGFWGVEVYNHGCFNIAGDTGDERVFEEMLRSGKNIFPLCTDDSHFGRPIDGPNCDAFGGWVMVKTENLEYKEVIEALKKGDFYSSTGPEITELYYENGKIHIECSDAREIIMNCLSRNGERRGTMPGEVINSADFNINPETQGYVRFKVIDHSGRTAYTRAFYIHDLIEETKPRPALL